MHSVKSELVHVLFSPMSQDFAWFLVDAFTIVRKRGKEGRKELPEEDFVQGHTTKMNRN